MASHQPTHTNAITLLPGTLQPMEAPYPELPVPEPQEVPQQRLDTEPFRPQHRPPTPILRILDDSQQTAESVRVRRTPFRIGRSAGDLEFPLDAQMSSEHAELILKNTDGRSVWHLRDCGSRNGTFVRISQLVVKPGQVILIGTQRYRIQTSCAAGGPSQFSANTTQSWPPSTPQSAGVTSWLVEADQGPEEPKRFPLLEGQQCVGRDPGQCSIVLDDPLVSPRHARIWRDKRSRWHLQNEHSLNGVWTQIDDIALETCASFQCGEQRFLFRQTRDSNLD